jgi:hypothetical protein
MEKINTLPVKNKPRLLDIVNDPKSEMVLECTRGHRVVISQVLLLLRKVGAIVIYPKGYRAYRYTIHIDGAQLHWKIAAQKYQKNYQKPIYIKNKKLCGISNTKNPVR